MRKIDKYIKDCNKCVSEVSSAISKGAMLTNEEYFDYYFKETLSGKVKKHKMITSKLYRAAKFLADGLLLADELRKNGYSNKEAVDSMKQVRDYSVLYFGEYFSIKCQDFNGVLYIVLKQGEEESTLEITSSIQLYKGILVLCSSVVCDLYSEKDTSLSDYVGEYLFKVNKEIHDGKEPKPFLHTKAIKTLRSCLRDTSPNEKSDEDCKVIELRSIG